MTCVLVVRWLDGSLTVEEFRSGLERYDAVYALRSNFTLEEPMLDAVLARSGKPNIRYLVIT